jgi:hypothetical protein
MGKNRLAVKADDRLRQAPRRGAVRAVRQRVSAYSGLIAN